MKIFITGATGLVGSFITKALLDEGHSITALYRAGAGRSLLRGVEDKITWAEGDILDVMNLEKAMDQAELVIHAAAIVSFSPRDKEQMFKINVEGTANVVNLCIEKKVRKMCHISSVAALGRPDRQKKTLEKTIITEQQQWVDSSVNSNYAQSKYLAELEVWRGISEGLTAVIVNPSVILGEGHPGKSSTRLLRYVWDEHPFYTDGAINYVDVLDVTACIKAVLFSDVSGERFILNGGSTSYKDFFTRIAASFGKKPPRWKVHSGVASVIWRLEALRSFFTGSNPLITKETAQAALHSFQYSNEKIREYTGLSFKSLEETTQRIAETFKVEV